MFTRDAVNASPIKSAAIVVFGMRWVVDGSRLDGTFDISVAVNEKDMPIHPQLAGADLDKAIWFLGNPERLAPEWEPLQLL